MIRVIRETLALAAVIAFVVAVCALAAALEPLALIIAAEG